MTLKPLAFAFITLSLAACGPVATKTTSTAAVKPIVFTEPDTSPAYYALNPFNYDAPPPFESHLQKAAAQPVTKMIVSRADQPERSLTLDENKLIIPLVDSPKRNMRYAALAEANEIDITAIDDFIQLVEGKARHYPPYFNDRKERRGYESKLKQVSVQLDTLASQPNASFDILIRAFKISVMGRNLDLGSIYTTKSLNYAQRILKINKDDAEANFWFGFSLGEGGGSREAVPYLDKAMKAGVQEAYLSAVNNYMMLEQKKNAVQVLKNYKVKYPQEAEVADRLIVEIEKQGRWNVWQALNTK